MAAEKIESVDVIAGLAPDIAKDAGPAIEEALAKGPVWIYQKGEVFVAFTRPPKEYIHRFVDKVSQNQSGTVLMFAELVGKAAVYPKGRALQDLFDEYPLLPGALAEEITTIARGDGPKAALRVASSKPKGT